MMAEIMLRRVIFVVDDIGKSRRVNDMMEA
jgi:hypothetical protein